LIVKRFLISLVLLIVLCAAAVQAAVRYVQPAEELDLVYSEVSISANLTEMLRNRQLSIVLSEQELSDLLKKRLAANPQVADKIEVKGAKFALQGDRLLTDIHAVYDSKWDIGAKLEFVLAWEDPDIIARHVRTWVKSIEIPASTFELVPIRIHTDSILPSHVGVRSVQFANQQLLIELKLK
jgi:hypothetical protein